MNSITIFTFSKFYVQLEKKKKKQLMIKAVLWSRLVMMRDKVRNTHTHVLWEKGFRGETLQVLVTKYG